MYSTAYRKMLSYVATRSCNFHARNLKSDGYSNWGTVDVS